MANTITPEQVDRLNDILDEDAPNKWVWKSFESQDEWLCDVILPLLREIRPALEDMIAFTPLPLGTSTIIDTDLELLPCPACNAANVHLRRPYRDARHSVECNICSMRGPETCDATEAVNKWNALPRASGLEEIPGLKSAISSLAFDIANAKDQINYGDKNLGEIGLAVCLGIKEHLLRKIIRIENPEMDIEDLNIAVNEAMRPYR